MNINASTYLRYSLLPLQRYGEFQGRSCRKEYWSYMLSGFLIVIGFITLVGTFFSLVGVSVEDGSWVHSFTLLVVGSFTLVTFLPALAVTVRRLHDGGRSGWFILLTLVPVVGVPLLALILMLPSDSEANIYGLHPDAEAPGG